MLSPLRSPANRGFPPPPPAAPAAGGWGNPGSLPCSVHKVVRVPAGSVLEVEALPEWRVVSLAPLLCAVVFWGVVAGPAAFGARGSSIPSRLRPLQVAVEAASSAARVGVLVLRPGRRRAVVSSGGSAGLVRLCDGGLQAVSSGCGCQLDGGGAFFFPSAGRGGEGEEGEGAAGVLLFWMGSVEDGKRLRLSLSLRLEMTATRWSWRLGEVSPPMDDQRSRFRPPCRMDLAVFQRSVSAIEPLFALGMWQPGLLHLRRWSGGAGGWMRRALQWRSWRTCGDFFVILVFPRVLFAVCPR